MLKAYIPFLKRVDKKNGDYLNFIHKSLGVDMAKCPWANILPGGGGYDFKKNFYCKFGARDPQNPN